MLEMFNIAMCYSDNKDTNIIREMYYKDPFFCKFIQDCFRPDYTEKHMAIYILELFVAFYRMRQHSTRKNDKDYNKVELDNYINNLFDKIKKERILENLVYDGSKINKGIEEIKKEFQK